MSAEGKPSPNHVLVPTDALGTAPMVDMDTNKHILNSLNNIDQTMGQMAGLIAKFCEEAGQAARKSGKDRLILHRTLMSLSQNMNITLAAQILKGTRKYSIGQ